MNILNNIFREITAKENMDIKIFQKIFELQYKRFHMNITSEQNAVTLDILYISSSIYLAVVCLIGIGLNGKALVKLVKATKVGKYTFIYIYIYIYIYNNMLEAGTNI